MFSYVAKSLLSKTLKTFLRKYLEEIEFESITYGSNSSNSDAAGSGWGVRLSNVKLREGMELIKLPGKRKRTVVVKKKVKRRKKKKSSKSKKAVESVDGAPKQKLDELKQQAAARPGRVRRSSSQGSISVPIPGVAKPIHIANQHAVQPSQNSHTENKKRSMSSGSEFDYFSSAPSTPVQQRTVICTPLGMCSSSRHRTNESADKLPDLKQIPVLPFDDEYDGTTTQDANQQLNAGQKVVSEPIELGPNIELAQDSIFRKNLSAQCSDDDSDGYASEDSVIEVEEERIIEDTMTLVVGAGGAIGTLNIRLVGKELHVTVEDAHLIIEALPMASDNGQSDETTSVLNGESKGHLRSDSTVSEASVDSIPDTSPSVDSATIGEKVKKKSMFARYLSMIPHLFLRDCRVSLILPGESEFNDDDSKTNSVGDCTVFECGIDFLSVTSGDDFIDVLRLDTGDSAEKPSPQSAPLPAKSNTNNVFSRKRIRTGKGPEGGLWMKIHPPNNVHMRPQRDHHVWARQKYLDSSAGFCFRCSGLDLHARMLIEVKDGVDEEIAAAWSSEYDDYTMDSMVSNETIL